VVVRQAVRTKLRRFEAVPLATVPRNSAETRAATTVQKVVRKEDPYAVPVRGEMKQRATKHIPGN
jgi:hypothetical protein